MTGKIMSLTENRTLVLINALFCLLKIVIIGFLEAIIIKKNIKLAVDQAELTGRWY